MEKFKIGDVVKNRLSGKYIFEIVNIFCDHNDNQILRGSYSGSLLIELDAVNAEHATKSEKIKYYEDRIKAEQAKLEDAKAIVEEPVWPLPEDTHHFSHMMNGEIAKQRCLVKHHCNQALSEKRAKQLYEKSRLMQDMYLWVDTFCPDWTPDWNDKNQNKSGIEFIENNAITRGYYQSSNYFIFGISVPTEDLAHKMLAEFKDIIEALY